MQPIVPDLQSQRVFTAWAKPLAEDRLAANHVMQRLEIVEIARGTATARSRTVWRWDQNLQGFSLAVRAAHLASYRQVARRASQSNTGDFFELTLEVLSLSSDHSCFRGMHAGCVVTQISQAHAHVMHDRSGDGDRYGDAEDGVGQGQRIDIAAAQKHKAGAQAPNERDRREDGVGEMGEGEHNRRGQRRPFAPGEKAQQSEQKESLQQKLLHKGPDGVAAEGHHPAARADGVAKGAQMS